MAASHAIDSILRGLMAAGALVSVTLPGNAASAGEVPPAPAGLWCPVDLEVIDVEATLDVLLKAGERPPVVVVHDQAVAGQVVDAFAVAFEQTRRNFLGRVQLTYGAPALDADAVAEPTFRDFRSQFQDTNPSFPVGPVLGQAWAQGFDAEPVRERIMALLRLVERDHLIGDVRPASTVFVVAAGAVQEARTWGDVAPRARSIEHAGVLSVAAAADRLRRMNDPLDRAADGFLGGLVRPNVTTDSYLTGLLLRDRMGSGVVHRWLPRGAPLAVAGRPVDRWAALALNQLERSGIRALDTQVPSAPAGGAGANLEDSDRVSQGSGAWGWWAAGVALAGIAAAGVVLTVIIVRRGRSSALDVMPGQAAGEGHREAMISHLARDLKDRLVRALFTQRSVLLANEQAASRRVQEMEERLARLQPAIAERIRGYEERIEALEKDIAVRDAETRDLIRAKLVLARKELEAEISRNRIDWN